ESSSACKRKERSSQHSKRGEEQTGATDHAAIKSQWAMTTPIIEIASKYLERVRPTGNNNITALCPFHADSTPSFALSLSSGLWICYACGAKGNLRQLLKGLGLNDQAIQVKYGATLSKLQQQRPPRPDPTKPLATKDPLPEEILGLFNLCPLA